MAVRRALEKAGFDLGAVFVDTVEKMQGQECDCVIVCYGAWTADQLAANPEFAYSLNRLVRWSSMHFLFVHSCAQYSS
jgi:hypothetical protein